MISDFINKKRVIIKQAQSAEGCEGEKITQILYKYCTYIVKFLKEYFTYIVQILYEYC